MGEPTSARMIALLLYYLKDALRGSEAKLSDRALAEMLLEVQRDTQNPVRLTGNKLNLIRNAKLELSREDEAKLLQALLAIAQRSALEVSSAKLEDRYASRLPSFLRNIRPNFFQGDVLGEVANFLSGAWHFFYVSPINRLGEFRPEIRSTAAFFQKCDSGERTVDVLLISGHSSWKGQAYVNDSHLYIATSDVEKTETAFFVTNRPSKISNIIVGVGCALERAVTRSFLRPVAGIVCFGTKAKIDHPERPELEALLQRTIRGDDITASDEMKIRTYFCATYGSFEDLRELHPVLHAHIQNRVQINNKDGFPLESLYVALT